MRSFWLLAFAGCMEAAEPATPGAPSCSFLGFYEMSVNDKLDLLFVIDDSSAMAPYQATLEANAPIFMGVLMSLPYSPNVRIAVARASDGSFVDPAPCGVQTDVLFLEDSHRDTVRNFTGTLPDAFTCLVRVGADAASSGQILTSTVASVTNHPYFLRDDAHLFVAILTPQDDTSPGYATDYADELRSFKPPGQVMASIVSHDQSVRLHAFVDSFGAVGSFASIDDASWVNALAIIAQKVGRFLGRRCIDGMLTQPVSCTFTRIADIGTSTQRELGTLPTCDPNVPSGNACVALVADQMCSASGASLNICYNGFDPAKPYGCPDGPNEAVEGETISIECAVKCQ